jgi:hypothetical protein
LVGEVKQNWTDSAVRAFRPSTRKPGLKAMVSSPPSRLVDYVVDGLGVVAGAAFQDEGVVGERELDRGVLLGGDQGDALGGGLEGGDLHGGGGRELGGEQRLVLRQLAVECADGGGAVLAAQGEQARSGVRQGDVDGGVVGGGLGRFGEGASGDDRAAVGEVGVLPRHGAHGDPVAVGGVQGEGAGLAVVAQGDAGEEVQGLGEDVQPAQRASGVVYRGPRRTSAAACRSLSFL